MAVAGFGMDNLVRSPLGILSGVGFPRVGAIICMEIGDMDVIALDPAQCPASSSS